MVSPHNVTYFNSRCVLNLNGHLFSVYMHFSVVQVACNATMQNLKKNVTTSLSLNDAY